MRILPYESAAVKVRIKVGAAKLGHFPSAWVGGDRRGQVAQGVWAARPPHHPKLRDSGIGKVCAKSRTGISDTDF